MSNYKILRARELDHDIFWNYIDKLNDKYEYSNCVYNRQIELFYMQKNLDDGFLINKLSFVILFNDEPYCAFLGVEKIKNGVISICFYDLPAFFVEDTCNISPNKKKKYLNEIENICNIKCDKSLFSELKNKQNMTFGMEYLLFKKNFNTEFHLTRKIDLQLPENILKKNIRKSYNSLVNWGLRELDIELYNSNNIEKKHIDQFRTLHISESGRETRSYGSWLAQYDLIKNSKSFIILASKNSELISAGLFVCEYKHCFYGVSVSRRDLFEKPLFHSIMWTAIINAKNLGMKCFETGPEYIDHSLFYDASEKEKQISLFKAGFGGRLELNVRARS